MPEVPGRPARVRFRLLGELSVEVDGVELPTGPRKQRVVLAVLLCRAGTAASVDTLTEALWPADPPRTAAKNLQGYVSALRRLLADAGVDGRISHGPRGYRLRVEDDELDTLRLVQLTRSGRRAIAAGDRAAAAEQFRRALDLWTGPPLAELADSDLLHEEAERLAGRRLALWEDWAEAALESGRAAEVADAAEDLVARHPLRERLREVQMVALARSGRRSEAQAAFDQIRQLMSRDLGLSPGAVLEARYRSVLAAGRSPAAPGPGAVRPVQLPPEPVDFTGRTSHVQALTEALTDGTRVVVLIGSTGAGTSALATHTAHRLAGEFPDGRILVAMRAEDGAPRPVEALLAELARIAGLPGPDPAGPLVRWQAWLAARRVLLVLDGAADESAVRALVPGSGRSVVVVTARTVLAGLAPARRIEVPPLEYAEAVELLGRIVGLGRLRSDPAAAGRIVEACGLLPLALRVAGLKLAVLRHLSMAEFAARLADPRTALDELAVGDVTVRSHVEREWRHLDARTRAALRRLGALPQPFTLDEATAALGSEPRTALRELERLIEIGAIVAPVSEVLAHAALYTLPRLTLLHVNADEPGASA